jgi:hypothetical protein
MNLRFEINYRRLAIDRVYLDECTVKAFQERARLENKREALQGLMSDIDMCIVESDAWLLTLKNFHREHAKEIKPKENA